MAHQTVHFARTIRCESSNELASYLGSWPSTSNETSKHHIVYSGKTAVNALFAEDFFLIVVYKLSLEIHRRDIELGTSW